MNSGKQSASSSLSSTTEYVNQMYTESVIAGSPVVSISVMAESMDMKCDVLTPNDERNSMKELGVYVEEKSIDFDKVPRTRFRNMYLAALAALVNAVSVGMSAAYTATATENMKGPRNLNPDEDEKSWIGSLLAVGALVGSLVAGNLAGVIGRKQTLLYNTIPFFCGWMFIVYAQSVPLVFVGRLLTGVGCGVACVAAPMYIVEISTPEVRGLLGAAFQLFVVIGVLLVSICGYYVSWRWVAVCGASISSISVIAMSPMPETPRWLMSKGRPLDAAMALKFLQGKNYNTSETCRSLEDSIKVQAQDDLTVKEFNQFVRMMKKLQAIVRSPAGYKSTILSIALMLFQQFSGINAIMFYTVDIFTKAGSTDGNRDTIILNALQVLATFAGSVLMDRAGRKVLLLFSGIVMGLSLTVMGTFGFMSVKNESLQHVYWWVPLICLGVFIIAFSVGYGPIPWLMVAEMTPSRFRSIISGVATALNWTFVFVVTKSFPFLQKGIKDYGSFWLFAFFCVASCFVTHFLLPETKGKTLNEIQEFFVPKSQKESKLSLADEQSSEYI